MERLQIDRACIASVTVGVIDLGPVVMVEAQPAIATASLLGFEQFGESGTPGWKNRSISRTDGSG
jgi:hypothetical protein